MAEHAGQHGHGGTPQDVQELQQRVDELEALVAAMAAQQQELVDRMTSSGVEDGRPPGDVSTPVVSAGRAGTGAVGDGATAEVVGRRALLGSAGRVAAGAIAGGAALALGQAGPAAAASGTFDGAPAVSATNTGGQGGNAVTAVGGTGTGVYATTTGGLTLSAVLASNDAVSGGRGLFVRNSSAGNSTGVAIYASGYGGTAILGATNSGSQAYPAIRAVNASSSGGIALLADNAAGIFGIAVNAAGGDGKAIVANGSVGVEATAPTGWAVNATSSGTSKDGSSVALRGLAPDGIAVVGRSTNSIGGQLSGGACDLRLGGLGVGSGAPATRDHSAGHSRGDLVQDTATGDLWLCVVAGAAGQVGTWRKLAGAATSGALHALAAPKRVFDSRSGFLPNNVAKGAFVNETKTIDAKNNASGVPAGATAVLVNLAVTNTNSGGYGALWAQGASPGTANINWGLANSTISNTVLTALKADGTFQCQIAGTADVIIDVVGYYR